MSEWLEIDGSHGEGGGQILRTGVGVSALTGRPVRFVRIRAGRKRPGLAAQHLTAVRSVARLCNARVEGDALGSQTLTFEPMSEPVASHLTVDVAAARHGGSAGSATLVLQAMIPVLLGVPGESVIEVIGGTHTEWSPPFDYLRDVWTAALHAMGARVDVELGRWGWYPAGGGMIRARVERVAGQTLSPLCLVEPGRLMQVRGRAVTSRLPDHIAERVAETARSRLAEAGILDVDVHTERPRAACAGAGIFLVADYEAVTSGFNALGRRGKPAEAVAAEAVGALVAHERSGAAVDEHLADQLLLPAALASGPSDLVTTRRTDHIATNAWVIERFGFARFDTTGQNDGTFRVRVTPEDPARKR